MANWYPLLALPNVRLLEPISRGHMAVVPGGDQRVQGAFQRDAEVETFFKSFSTPFSSRESLPSALLVDLEQFDRVPLALAYSFRDCVAISHLTRAWAAVGSRRSWLPLYSDYFDVYPAHVGRDGSLMWLSAAMFGEADLHDHRGQSSPFVADPESVSFSTDEILLEGLLAAWEGVVVGRREAWRRRLFRAVEMSMAASRAPMKDQTGQLDLGVSVSLWVSAFETLSYGMLKSARDKSGFGHVAALLDSVPWVDERMTHKRHAKKGLRSRRTTPLSFAARQYLRIHRARNDVMHGNPLPASGVERQRYRLVGESIQKVAPLLFRACVVQVLRRRKLVQKPRGLAKVSALLYCEGQYERALFGDWPML